MQTNTGNNMGGNEWNNAKFVKRVEMAAMQFAILSKAQQGEVTRDSLKQVFRGNLEMHSGDHFEHCLTQLVQDGHLKEIGGNKYTITDDGREDVQKLFTLIQELPTVVGNVGGQRSGMTQTQTAGSKTGGVSGGNVGGGTTGNVGGTTGKSGQGNTGTGNVGGTSGGNVSSSSGGQQGNKNR